MKNKLIYPMVLVVGFGVACGGRETSARNAAQQQYETVQEGSAAGVTSTIAGPGETLPPITGTNADTTTAFALNPNAAPAGTVPQQAQAIPAYPTGDVPPPMMSSSPAPSYSTPASAPVRRPVASAPQQASQPSQPQPQQPQAQPVPAQPAPAQTAEPKPAEPAEAAGPADMDTAATAQPEPEPPKKEEPPPPPADDTSGTQAEEPPPPPPPAFP